MSGVCIQMLLANMTEESGAAALLLPQPKSNFLYQPLAFLFSRKGSSTKVGAVHDMSEESLPNGCSNSGQKKVS